MALSIPGLAGFIFTRFKQAKCRCIPARGNFRDKIATLDGFPRPEPMKWVRLAE
jgi:hypothetical protein